MRVRGDMWDRRVLGGLWRWRRTRVLELTPFCILCNTEDSLQVHHVDGNRWNNTWANLAPLCKPCHIKAQRLPYLGCPDCGNLLHYFEGLWLCESALPVQYA